MHRLRRPGGDWSAEAPLGFPEGRNWGPDLIALADGSAVVAFDHAKPNFSSQGFVTTWAHGRWSPPEALTPDDPEGEIGSGHIADMATGDLAYVWIGKKMDPAHRFRAHARWRKGGAWTAPQALSDGRLDAWHSNIERRPDGSALVGWDEGVGGGQTTLYVAEVRDGQISAPEDLSRPPGKPGERAHFAFGPDGADHVAWFHKERGRPLHIYVRSGKPGAWEDVVQTPAEGLGGFHFDPDIAVNDDGVRVIVWGWDAGADAELLYSIDRGQGWEAPHRVARIGWGKPGLPSLVTDRSGAFHVVWNQGERGDNHVYMATLRL